ncbi:MAG TPA: 23S rRNA (uracil(1939)-C(5))-methyltransferase RlmD [Candidatus Fimenecus excrementigallinarum]|uniref:23S rRNA (Uracil(1939)-C(5))-methyltransferase RlmD n=1 Tax=Candidatus Fimenecus excrementigallinarum TaxID=2840816 RepID=A0A9D1IFY1_9FIRM|nr:23S rRNA (uracil(1939)-C(5))-methyltransferase RlmD [Candidatus Fimenecus excrementigallinarum]
MAVPQKNQTLTLKIESLTAEGSGVGRANGFAVFVRGGLPGDTVEAHVIKTKAHYAVAKVTRILEPSPHRTENACPLFPRCGGCALREADYAFEAAQKRARVEEAFRRLAGLSLPVSEMLVPDSPDRYRNKAQYPVATENGRVVIGFYAPRTHRVVDCTDCLLQPAEFAGIVRVFRTFLEEFGVSVYDPATGRGLVRHLYLRKGFQSGEILVCIVLNGERLPHADALVRRLTAQNGHIASIQLNHNTARTNVILGGRCTVLWGAAEIADTLCGVRVRLSPLSFYQVNHDMAERLYEKAAEFAALTGRETVLDLYCGAGLVGLSMAKGAKRLYGAEIVPEAVADARRCAAENGVQNAEFFCGDAKDAAKRLLEGGARPDVVLLDPPRKGCDEAVLAAVAEMAPERIVYISCDPATLARDAARLLSHGYAPVRLACADLFPRTSHVESVCLFARC